VGEAELAREALAHAEAGVDALASWERFDALLEVAPAVARLGKPQRAAAMLQSADGLIEQQTNQLATIASRRADVVERLVAVGDLGAALNAAGAIPLARERAQALTRVAAAQGKQDAASAAALLGEVLASIRSQTFGHERALALADVAPVLHALNRNEGIAAAREAAVLAESVNVDRSLRSALRRTAAAALHGCDAQAEAIVLWRAELADARLVGRAQTLQSVAAGVPLLAGYEDARMLERIGRGILAAEAWWSGTPLAASAGD
jgi:hypothetical protein